MNVDEGLNLQTIVSLRIALRILQDTTVVGGSKERTLKEEAYNAINAYLHYCEMKP